MNESAVGPQGSGWFHVAPTLRVGAGGRERVPLDGVMCQTVLSKCLGPLPRWESVLRVAHECGYNMLHFTPVQELGASRSSYSIANQLRLNPQFGAEPGREPTFADVENLVSKMRSEWKMLSICDIVLNHTANETAWLAEHPEATYNCGNCPHLRPAALLDALLARLSAGVARGEHEARGVARRVERADQLEALRALLLQALPELRLQELYCCDVAALLHDFYCLARNKVPAPAPGGAAAELRLLPDPQFRRLRATVDMDLALQLYNVYRAECYDEESRLKKCCEEMKRKLEELNEAAADTVRDHLRAAVDNVIAGVRYERLEADGPRVQEVSARHPLAPRYFTWACAVDSCSAAEAEAALYSDAGWHCMAHNGWVMDADPLQDFAARAAGARVYLRRELIAWGDSVKLRYGDRPDDCAFLWRHMREYVELTAELFDGVRLDNCHSTPLHVAEYMLDCARNVKPDLYVVAELFTNSDHVDNIFVNRLGITSLIREAQSAWDSHEQGRLLHRFGGRPLHAELAARGYSELYVDQLDGDVLAVTRHEPRERRSVLLVAHTAFRAPDPHAPPRQLKPLRFEGQLDEIMLEAFLRHKDYESEGGALRPPGEFTPHPRIINGLTDYELGLALGFNLRARLAFAHDCGRHARTVAACYGALARCWPSCALALARPAELCNAGGAYCADSCRTQAWRPATPRLRAARPAAWRACAPAAPPPRARAVRLAVQPAAAPRPPTVVYSDRYFRYGLPCARAASCGRRCARRPPGPRTCCACAAPRRASAARRAAAAGAGRGAARSATSRRGRAPCGAAHAVRAERPAFSECAAAERRRAGARWAGGRRRPACGPRLAPAGAVRARPGAGWPLPPPAEAARPQFALEEGGEWEAAPAKAWRLSANLAPAEADDKAESMALSRKVLNTERYNNGAQAVLYRRGGGAGGGAVGGRRMRATVRAMLALSSMFYALSFLAFYFLSLP
uniref:Glycogen debranching enzyme glucanotransferase domain-containing protein n=1 Tax=Heliothis virescens TaxID=7102 RepID=A0A2A4JG90_HELVI